MIESVHPSSPETRGAPVRGVIFDLDGTLADTLHDIMHALNTALRSVSRRPADADQVRAWVGDGLPTLCRKAAPDADEGTLAALVEAARTAYAAHPYDRARLYAGIREALTALAERHVPLAVLSNKPHDLTIRTIDGLGIGDLFHPVRGCVSEADRKPAPGPALAIAQGWGLTAASIVLVGDSATDIATARAAGMRCVAVKWGFRDAAELRAAKPDYLISEPAELIRVLTEWPVDA